MPGSFTCRADRQAAESAAVENFVSFVEVWLGPFRAARRSLKKTSASPSRCLARSSRSVRDHPAGRVKDVDRGVVQALFRELGRSPLHAAASRTRRHGARPPLTIETRIDGADVGPRDPGRSQPDELAIIERYDSPSSEPWPASSSSRFGSRSTASAARAPFLHQARAARSLSASSSLQGGPRRRRSRHEGSVRVQLDERQKEGVMDDFSGILLGEPVSPAGAADEADEKGSVKLFQHGPAACPGFRTACPPRPARPPSPEVPCHIHAGFPRKTYCHER